MAITTNGLKQLGFVSGTDYNLKNDGDGIYIEWLSESTQPTEAEIEAADTQWHTNNNYKNNRKEAYPSIGDQLDMLYHAIDSGNLDKTSDFYTSLKSIKDANPKPE